MSAAFFQMHNTHSLNSGNPPTFSNDARNSYFGYFQNRFGEQWVFVYDYEKKLGGVRRNHEWSTEWRARAS